MKSKYRMLNFQNIGVFVLILNSIKFFIPKYLTTLIS
jgi:hypothetical protein